MTPIDPNAAYEALRALEAGVAEPGRVFDWDPRCLHGYAARQVAYALPGRVTWKEALAALEQLEAQGRVLRVRLPDSARLRAEDLVGNEHGRYFEPDHIVPVFRTMGG